MMTRIGAIGFGVSCFLAGAAVITLMGTSAAEKAPSAQYQVSSTGKGAFVLDTQTGHLWMREGPLQFDMGTPDCPIFESWSRLQNADKWLYEHRRTQDIDVDEDGRLVFKNDLAVIFPGLAQVIDDHRKAGWSDARIALDIRKRIAKCLDEDLPTEGIEVALFDDPSKKE